MINLIHGDALEELPKLEFGYDLVVADPPNDDDMDYVDKIFALVEARKKTVAGGRLALYGITLSKLLNMAEASGWLVNRAIQIHQIVAELRNGEVTETKPVGYVVIAMRGVSPTAAPVFSAVSKKGFEGHPTAKGVDWFLPLFGVRTENVLDPFAGLGAVGLICKELNLPYTGIELDDDYFKQLENKLLKD